MATETLNKESALAVSYFEAKLAFEIGPVELKMSSDKGEKFQVIDLRTPEYFAKGHVPGAVNVNIEELEAYTNKLNKDVTSVVYCYDKLCYLSAKAALLLAKKGYKVRELAGGYDGYAEKGFQTAEGKASCGTACSA